jgi:methyl-accepting chemotaxis protein
MFKDLKISKKLLVLILVPIVGLLAFVIISASERYSNLRNIRETQVLVSFSVKSGNLIHELQKERGLSAGFLKSQGSRFKDDLADQRRKSDQQAVLLTSFVKESTGHLAPISSEVKKSEIELSGLRELRSKVDGQGISGGDAIKTYSSLIRSYLDAIAVIPTVCKNKEISMNAVGYHAFISAKEMAGQERANLNGGFAADKFDQELYLKAPGLIAVQTSYLNTFSKYADPASVKAYEERSSTPSFKKVEEFRKIAFDKGLTGGMGVRPEDWFSTITTKINLLKEVEDLLAKNINSLADELADKARTAMLVNLFFAASMIVVSLLLGTILIRGITNPLNEQIDMLKDIAEGEGDLSRRLRENRKDELGDVALWFNRFIDNIHGIVSQVSGTTARVATASVQLQSTAEQIATAAEEVAAQSATVATAGEEMSATSCDISRNCLIAAEGAQQAASTTREGFEVVRHTVKGIRTRGAKTEENAKVVGRLGERSDQIGAIAATIEDIADQTNLLALNAAIEAARAGEMGRGFAVVADEVRALAERTSKATKEIGDMIRAIQIDTKQAISSMEEEVRETQKGAAEAEHLEAALQDILNRVSEMTDQINQIATAAEEQTATTSEISTNIHQITDVVQQTASGAHETADAAASLSKSAHDLERLIGRFRL